MASRSARWLRALPPEAIPGAIAGAAGELLGPCRHARRGRPPCPVAPLPEKAAEALRRLGAVDIRGRVRRRCGGKGVSFAAYAVLRRNGTARVGLLLWQSHTDGVYTCIREAAHACDLISGLFPGIPHRRAVRLFLAFARLSLYPDLMALQADWDLYLRGRDFTRAVRLGEHVLALLRDGEHAHGRLVSPYLATDRLRGLDPNSLPEPEKALCLALCNPTLSPQEAERLLTLHLLGE